MPMAASAATPVSVSMSVPPELRSGAFSPAALPTLPPGSPLLRSGSRDRRFIVGGVVAAVLALGVWAIVDGDEGEGGGSPSSDGSAAVGQGISAARGDGAGEAAGDGTPLELMVEDGPDEERLVEIDRLISGDKLGEAQQLLQPLLDEYPHNAMLSWRQGRIFAKSKKSAIRSKGLVAYGEAVDAEPSLLDDHDFYAELYALLIDTKLRTEALNFALRRMGRTGHKFLLELVNDERHPMSYNDRRRALQELSTIDENDAMVNWQLHRALDLLQATQALTPCTAYRDALDSIAANPDYWYMARVQRAELPKPKTGKHLSDEEKADAAACEGIDVRRTEVIAELEKLAPIEDTGTEGGDDEIVLDDESAAADGAASKESSSSGSKSSGSKSSGSKSGCKTPFGIFKKQCR
jgi:hypothetical protein